MLKGARVSLAPLREADVDKLFGWINDRDEVLLGAAYRPVHESAHREWIKETVRRPDTVIFAIRAAPDERLVGYVQLVGIDPRARSAELRIRIGDRDARGQGVGLEAGGLILRHAFEDLNLERVWAHVFPTNEPVRRGARRLGFQEEGRLRRAAYLAGEYVDVIVIGILRSEFQPGESVTGSGSLG